MFDLCAAYFECLVLHFHDELLLLFLPSTSFLELGLDTVDLQLILHNCREYGKVDKLTARIKKVLCLAERKGGKIGRNMNTMTSFEGNIIFREQKSNIVGKQHANHWVRQTNLEGKTNPS